MPYYANIRNFQKLSAIEELYDVIILRFRLLLRLISLSKADLYNLIVCLWIKHSVYEIYLKVGIFDNTLEAT